MDKATHVFNKLATHHQVAYNMLDRKFKITSTSKNSQGLPYYNVTVAKQFNTKAGPRYYKGTGGSAKLDWAVEKGRDHAKIRMTRTPADSMTTRQYNKFK